LLQPDATIKAKKFPSTVKQALLPGRTLSASQSANAARVSAAATRTIRDERAPTIESDSSQMGSFFLVIGVGLAGIFFAIKAGTEK
jgi:hypothetical protein